MTWHAITHVGHSRAAHLRGRGCPCSSSGGGGVEAVRLQRIQVGVPVAQGCGPRPGLQLLLLLGSQALLHALVLPLGAVGGEGR